MSDSRKPGETRYQVRLLIGRSVDAGWVSTHATLPAARRAIVEAKARDKAQLDCPGQWSYWIRRVKLQKRAAR